MLENRCINVIINKGVICAKSKSEKNRIGGGIMTIKQETMKKISLLSEKICILY